MSSFVLLIKGSRQYIPLKIRLAEFLNREMWVPCAATNYVMYVVPVIGLAIIALLYLELEERFPEWYL